MKSRSSLILSGKFGEVIIDTLKPCLRSLKLRQNNNRLSKKSLLSAWPSETLPYTTGAYTYVEDLAGVRYESTASTSHTVDKINDDEVVIRNIELRPDKLYTDTPVTEDWHFSIDENGDLKWEIKQTWHRKFEIRKSGSPGLFFNTRSNAVPTGSGQRRLNPEKNGVATFLWVEKEKLEDAGYYEALELIPAFFKSCELSNYIIYNRKNAWARVKLYTSFPNDRDLYLKAENGYLFRRGKYNSHSEIGLLNHPGNQRYTKEASLYNNPRKIIFRKNQKTEFALHLGSRKAVNSGTQLKTELPDRKIQEAAQNFYNGLLNAGMWASQKNYFTGNQPDGWQLFCFWMPSLAAMVGSSCPDKLSADPFSVHKALKEENLWLLGNCVNKEGRVITPGLIRDKSDEGFLILESNLYFIMRLDSQVKADGDFSFIKENISSISRLIAFFDDYISDFLLDLKHAEKALVYFDAWTPSGHLAYLNIFYAKALEIYSDFLEICGNVKDAEIQKEKRQKVIEAINELFWDDNAFGEGMGGYIDMIDVEGKKHRFFSSATEYTAIVFGVASRSQALKILETADRRHEVLKKEFGYKWDATLDSLWPVNTTHEAYPFGTYQNGACLTVWTYFEILAWAQSGNIDKAFGLFKNFFEHASKTNWFEGDSAFNIKSEPHGWGQEPFLSDQVVVAAALVHGLMGISQTLHGIKVEGSLPGDWKYASVEIPCLGKNYKVERIGSKTQIKELK